MDKIDIKKKICITGGHLSPAVAVIEEIQKHKKNWDIVFVGREKTARTNTFVSEEKQIIEQLHIPFVAIHAGKVSRIFSLNAFVDFLFFPVGFFEALIFCLREKPHCIVSFGGYIGLPVVIAGWLVGIPVVIHEQTHMLGLANKIASEFADKILLTFPDIKKQKDGRVHVTGLPLRTSFLAAPEKVSFPILSKKPILYITGGTTGAVSMNDLLFPLISSLVGDYTVIHQTGQQSYAKALTVMDVLPEESKSSYIPMPYVASEDVSWIMHHAQCIVGRSGANTVAEIAALKKPAVLLPLPWAGSKEQLRNATWYASVGGDVIIVDQQKVSSSELYEKILKITKSHTEKNISIDQEKNSAASTAIVNEITSLL
ncbi:MAG: glycosyltransferase [Microgenomates group bacterium]